MSKRLLLPLFQLKLLCLVKHFNKTCTPAKYDIVCQRTRNESTTNRVELFSTAILKFKHAKQAVKNNQKLLVFINFYYSFFGRVYVCVFLSLSCSLLLLNFGLCGISLLFNSIIRALSKPGTNFMCTLYTILPNYHVTFVDLLELNSTVIIVSSCICVCVCGISKLEKMLIKMYHSFIHNVFVFDWLFSWSWSKISIDNWKQMFLVFLSNYFLSSIVYPSISHSRGISTNFKHNFRSCWHSFGSTSKIHCNEISRVASLIERKKKSIQPVDGSSNALNDFSRQKLNFSTFF